MDEKEAIEVIKSNIPSDGYVMLREALEVAISALTKSMGGRVLTCVYCGMQYPQDTPASGSQVLTDHIKVCEKHPLRQAEETIAKLQKDLASVMLYQHPVDASRINTMLRNMTVPQREEFVNEVCRGICRDCFGQYTGRSCNCTNDD